MSKRKPRTDDRNSSKQAPRHLEPKIEAAPTGMILDKVDFLPLSAAVERLHYAYRKAGPKASYGKHDSLSVRDILVAAGAAREELKSFYSTDGVGQDGWTVTEAPATLLDAISMLVEALLDDRQTGRLPNPLRLEAADLVGQSRDILRYVLGLGPAPAEKAVLRADANGYSTPENYARDKWLYENIETYTFPDLSLKLRELASRKKWQVIRSRNGLKKAADRYAAFHNVRSRRFAPDTV